MHVVTGVNFNFLLFFVDIMSYKSEEIESSINHFHFFFLLTREANKKYTEELETDTMEKWRIVKLLLMSLLHHINFHTININLGYKSLLKMI